MPVVAHAGHWITYVLFLGPTLGFIVWLVVITVRDRRLHDSGGLSGAGAVAGGDIREVVATASAS
jgi:hypothetical protein